MERFEIERKQNELEKQILAINKEHVAEIDQVRQLININLPQKADYRDLEKVTHLLKNKSDSD